MKIQNDGIDLWGNGEKIAHYKGTMRPVQVNKDDVILYVERNHLIIQERNCGNIVKIDIDWF